MLSMGHMQLLDALYTSRKVSVAAALLEISQPTASAWLRKLRRHFRDELFVRTAEGMQPTPRANDLIEDVRTVLEALKTLNASGNAFEPSYSRRRFRLQCPDGNTVTLLPQLHHRMKDEAPNTSLEAIPLDGFPEETLRNHQADLVLSLTSSKLRHEFASYSFRSQGWVCLVSSTNTATKLTEATYQQFPHVNVAHSGWSDLLELGLATRNVDREVSLELSSVLGLPHVLEGTSMIATIPEKIGAVLAQDHRVRIMDCPLPMPNLAASLYWAHQNQLDAGHQWFRGLVREIFEATNTGSSTPI